jgi:two-component system, chemotaxis family, sensor kinase CheA
VALLSLETNPQDAEAVNTIFRGFHTIKGTSAFLGLSRMSGLAHCAESLLSRVRDNEIRCTGGYADLALRSVDMLKSLVQSVQNALGGGLMTVPPKYEELKSLLANPEAAGISAEHGPDSGEPAPAKMTEREEWDAEIEHAGEPVTHADEEKVQEPPPFRTPASGQAGGAAPSPVRAAKLEKQADSSVRVSTDRLDRLVDMVGELVIADSMVAQDDRVRQGGNHDLMRKVSHLGKIVRELQDLAMSMRMVPLKATFQKMGRLVRDLSHKSGKKVHLITEDNETEIDRNMVDIINDLLVHMVRNSVDHGIEHPDDRKRAGKDEMGTVFLSASHSGGNVVVQIRDDGKGLDRNRIFQKAVEKGLVDSDKPMSDADVFNLIFAPGFSTADKVTDVSGRGVGMDVVRKGVEALRGRIDILSEFGKGCIFTVRLPLTLAVTDGMLIRVGQERYIVPTANIHLSFRPEPGSLSTIASRGEMVMLRGELMPMFRLHHLFNIVGAVEDPTKGLLVVVGDGERRCTILVDELLGQQQVVAKSLGEGLGKIQGVSGAAILGDGRVGLIIDPSEVIQTARQSSGVTA